MSINLNLHQRVTKLRALLAPEPRVVVPDIDHMSIEPPFEFEVAIGAPARRYLLDCMPSVIDDGRFKAHLVVIAEKGHVVMFTQPDIGPLETAVDAAQAALQIGIAWLQCDAMVHGDGFAEDGADGG
jgi:hypothetical protein